MADAGAAPCIVLRYNMVMATRPRTRVTGITTKQQSELAIFHAFRLTLPNFAGRAVVSVQCGGDLPDVLCLDAQAVRIGIELLQWVNERQMAESKSRHRLEDSYAYVIQSSCEEPPANIGLVLIYPKEKTLLAPQKAAAFRKELYEFVEWVDAAWRENPEWGDPQGHRFVDFAGYRSLAQHIQGLDFYARGPHFDPHLGDDWITFEAHGCAYTATWMRDALLDNIKRKIEKYAKPNNRLRLQQQQLAEFYLLAYYDEAVLHNTPYETPGFGFKEIAAVVARELTRNPHPFDKVFLYSPVERIPVLQIWPSR